jgi:hypothetical protein
MHSNKIKRLLINIMYTLDILIKYKQILETFKNNNKR